MAPSRAGLALCCLSLSCTRNYAFVPPAWCPRAAGALRMMRDSRGRAPPFMVAADASDDAGASTASSTLPLSLRAATGASGAFLGWAAAHALDLELDAYGAAAGAALGLYASGQDGLAGKAARTAGDIALASFSVLRALYEDSRVGSRLTAAVGAEFVEVIELASTAASKGYVEALGPREQELLKELVAANSQVKELRGSLRAVKAGLATAEADLKATRTALSKYEGQPAKGAAAAAAAAEAKEVENAQKAAAAMAAAQADAAAQRKEAEAARAAAKRLTDELAAAKAEKAGLRAAVDSSDDLTATVEKLYKSCDALQGRVEDYEDRLAAAVGVNEAARASYEVDMAKARQQRSALEAELASTQKQLAAAVASAATATAPAAEAAATAPAAEAAAAPARVAVATPAAAMAVEAAAPPKPKPAAPAASAAKAAAVSAAVAVAAPPPLVPPRATVAARAASGARNIMWSADDLMKKTVKELRELCKEFGVATTGKKAELIEKLVEGRA